MLNVLNFVKCTSLCLVHLISFIKLAYLQDGWLLHHLLELEDFQAQKSNLTPSVKKGFSFDNYKKVFADYTFLQY